MAAPTLQAEAAAFTVVTTGACAPTIPTHVADDILLATVMVWVPATSGAINDIPTPSNWNKLGSVDLNGATKDGQIAWFWRRATAAGTTVSFARGEGWDTGTDGAYGARVDVIRGCETSGDPFDHFAASTQYTTANQNTPAVTVEGAERLVMFFGAHNDDSTTAKYTAQTGFTMGTNRASTTGTGGGARNAWLGTGESVAAAASTHTAPAAGRFYAFGGISFKPPPPPEEPEEEETPWSEAVKALGPVIYHRRNEPSGSWAWDSSGNKRHSSYKNTPNLGQAGGLLSEESLAVQFRKAEQEYDERSDEAALDLGDIFSAIFIVKTPASVSDGINALMSKGSKTYYMRREGARWQIVKSQTSTICTSTVNLVANTWYFVAFTKTGATVKIYQAVIEPEATLADVTGSVSNATLENNAAALTVGWDSQQSEYGLNTIDEDALFSTALSKAALEELLGAALEQGPGGIEVPLGSAVGVSDTTLAAKAKTTIPSAPTNGQGDATLKAQALTEVSLGSVDGASDTALSLRIPVALPCGESIGIGDNALVLHAPNRVPLGDSASQSDNALTVVVPVVVPLDATAGQADNSLAPRVEPEVPLGSSDAAADTALTFKVPVQVPAGAASGLSETSLAANAATAVVLASVDGQSDTALSPRALTLVPLDPAAGQSDATLKLETGEVIEQPDLELETAGQGDTALAMRAPTAVPLDPAAGALSATLALRAESLPIAPSVGVSDTQAALTVKTTIPLDSAEAQSDTSLASKVPVLVPLDAATGQSETSLGLDTTTYVTPTPAEGTSEATLELISPKEVPLAVSAGQSDVSLALTARATVPLGPSTGQSEDAVELITPVDLVLQVSVGQSDNPHVDLVAPIEVALAEALGISITELTAHVPALLTLEPANGGTQALLSLLYGDLPAVLCMADRTLVTLTAGDRLAGSELPLDQATEVTSGDREVTVLTAGDRPVQSP